MKAHSRSDDHDPCISQRFKRATRRDMRLWVEVLSQRQLDHGNVGLWPCDLHRNEDAVVPAAFMLLRHGEASVAQQLGGAVGDGGRSGRIPFQGIGMRREIIIVEQKVRTIRLVHGKDRLLPMRGHDQHGLRSFGQALDQLRKIILHRLPHRVAIGTTGIGRVHEEARTAAMRDVKAGLFHDR